MELLHEDPRDKYLRATDYKNLSKAEQYVAQMIVMQSQEDNILYSKGVHVLLQKCRLIIINLQCFSFF
jgi:hypothetical protein